MDAAWALVAIFVGLGMFGLALGYVLDLLLGTTPWLLFIGTIGGLGVGAFLIIHYGWRVARQES